MTTAAKVAQPQQAANSVSYDDAMNWLRTTPRFAFVLDEGSVHAEGTMTRNRIGAEAIELRANGERWRARATAQGVTWEKDAGGRWGPAEAPPYGNRLFQRVTLVFDPAKKEGEAQLVEPNHYRFTNANTGEVHDVWLAPAGTVERIRIGDAFELKITS